jgi:hypothetical protein
MSVTVPIGNPLSSASPTSRIALKSAQMHVITSGTNLPIVAGMTLRRTDRSDPANLNRPLTSCFCRVAFRDQGRYPLRRVGLQRFNLHAPRLFKIIALPPPHGFGFKVSATHR